MKKVLLALAISGCTLGSVTSVMAQAVPPAPPGAGGAGGIAGLSTGALVGGLLAVGVLAAILGGDGNGTTTTPSSPGT